MGPHEIATICIAGVVGFLGFIARDLYGDVRALRVEVAVLKSTAGPQAETVHDHGIRLAALELKLAEIGSGVRHIAEWVDEQKRRAQ